MTAAYERTVFAELPDKEFQSNDKQNWTADREYQENLSNRPTVLCPKGQGVERNREKVNIRFIR